MSYFLSMAALFFIIFGLFYGGWLIWLAKGKDKVMGIILFLASILVLGWIIISHPLPGIVFKEGILALLGTIVGVAIPTIVIIVAMLD